MTSIQMPQLGETVIEGTILKWLKEEGERIEADEPLFELSTDKVDTEVPSPVSGVVTKILVPEGTTVAVGTHLAEIDSGDTAASGGATASGVGAPADNSASAPSPAATETPVAASLPDRGPRSQILSPLVRKLAEEHHLDLSRITGSGTGGRITKKDVMAAVAAGGTSEPSGVPAAPAPALRAVPGPAVAGAGEEVVAMSHIRKAIATHMVGSLQATARAWNMVEVNMEHVVRTRSRV